MASFSNFFYRQYRPEKCVLRYSRTKKRLSTLQKPRSLKSRKIEIFPNGLTHGFGQKIAIFPAFIFLGNIRQKNMFNEILEPKNDIVRQKNKNFKQSKN